MPQGYRSEEILRLYRSLLKGAYAFPLASRRTIVSAEVKEAFRHPHNDTLTTSEVDYKLTLGWERAAAIGTYASNMHWFHSRDEVNKDMMEHSLRRDRERVERMEKHNREGAASEVPRSTLPFTLLSTTATPVTRR